MRNCKNSRRCLIFTAITLVTTLTFVLQEASGYPSSNCRGSCDQPKTKEKARCTIVPPSDKSFPRPTTPKNHCFCPLYKCSTEDGSGFYTLHITKTGQEKVNYSKDRSIVSSVGEGDHDSKAVAGGDAGDIEDALKQIQETLGISL